MNPGPLHWKHGVLATGPPGKSLVQFFEASIDSRSWNPIPWSLVSGCSQWVVLPFPSPHMAGGGVGGNHIGPNVPHGFLFPVQAKLSGSLLLCEPPLPPFSSQRTSPQPPCKHCGGVDHPLVASGWAERLSFLFYPSELCIPFNSSQAGL